jgi:hypothetical protein
MKKLVDDSNLRLLIGTEAEASMQSYQAQAEQGDFLEEIMAIRNQKDFLPNTATIKARDLQKLRVALTDPFPASPKSLVSGVRRLVDRHVSWRFKS